MTKPGLYKRWQDVDMSGWRWSHFTPAELACKCPRDLHFCEGEYFHDPDFLDCLEKLREIDGNPLHINSARRCPQRNAAVKGAAFSQHKLGIACDISLSGHDPVVLARAAARVGFKGIGFGRTFLHVDSRTPPPGWRGRWPTPVSFHYAGGREAWTKRFGFDPKPFFDKNGHLDG